MSNTTASPRYYWTRFDTNDRPPGGELAALRRGLGRPVGEVPAMWPYYTHLHPDGRLSNYLRAEHVALTLFAVHQQSQSMLMHQSGITLGAALAALKAKPELFSPAGIDRRFAAAATASSLAELSGHLRSLVSQLAQARQPLDYTRLVTDLKDWQDPERVGQVRRHWGMAYFTKPAEPDNNQPVSA